MPLDAPKSADRGPAATAARHSYSTPYGKLVAQVQKSGLWGAATIVLPGDGRREATATLVGNLLASWKDLESPALPRLHAFDPHELRCTWVLPDSALMVPLASLLPTLSPHEVGTLITGLAEPLGRLHRVGLGAFDLSPSAIFARPGMSRAIVVPTPWLASLANWSPGRVTDMPFVAPELDRSRQAYPDPVRADVWALGALAWHLLTGSERKRASSQLPSELAPDLAPWDAFVDGCSRSNPARRFESVASAVQSLGVDALVSTKACRFVSLLQRGASGFPAWC
jgi:serine/threonine protein kinase